MTLAPKTSPAPSAPPRARPRLAEIVTDKRLALMLALGFSSGLPFLLIFSTQSAWLREVGISRTEIGLMSYVALAYTFKFAWAPFIDRFDVPGLARLLGRRRAWMLVAQLCVAAGLAGLAFGDPAHRLGWTIGSAFLTAFAAATQDVVIDGWRIDAAPPERQGMMSATYQLGYRLALLCAGAGALYIADFASWRGAYLTMAALMAVGIAACLLSPSTNDDRALRKDGSDVIPGEASEARQGKGIQDSIQDDGFPSPRAPSERSAGNDKEANRSSFATSFVEPLADLVKRHGWTLAPILVLVALYRLPDFISGVMANPLYIDLGFSLAQIATVSKVFGVWVGIAGAFGGGIAVSRLGLMPSLLIGGAAASASHLAMALLAASGQRIDLLTLAIGIENFAGGFAGTALIAYMSSLTSPAYAATQYALLSSLYALPGKLIGGLSGFMVDMFGYPKFFVASSTIGIPVVILCLLVWRLSPAAKSDQARDGTQSSAEKTASA